MLHKEGKDRQTIGIRPEQVLGMPLHGPYKTLTRQLHRLDEAIGSDCHRDQSFAEVPNRLMVQRVYVQEVFAQQGLKVTTQGDLMRWGVVRFALSVNNLRGML